MITRARAKQGEAAQHEESQYHAEKGQISGKCNRKRKLPHSTDRPTGETCACITRLKIPGFREQAVEDYCQWLCMQVRSDQWKRWFLEVKEIILEEGVELARLHEAPKTEARLLVDKGIKRGIALQFTTNVQTWLDERHSLG